jgi:hypothetical protein
MRRDTLDDIAQVRECLGPSVLAPLVKAIGDDQAAPSPKGITEQWQCGHRLGARIDWRGRRVRRGR